MMRPSRVIVHPKDARQTGFARSRWPRDGDELTFGNVHVNLSPHLDESSLGLNVFFKVKVTDS